ncbi:PHP domain-containing protein [Draconibacterium mangrovi]|uniref:PHP domain-containing protein n=1 Tax=Draconibacterium mangrovi TaxID=2697469 RepID=UPI0013D11290|nr:PHP domain-containing protein [Draconibacterium mangrovi]
MIDLHIHSNYSNDGEFEIADIVTLCKKNGVEFFSITDHNSVKGNKEAALEAEQKGIEFAAGIKIDCNYKGTNLHVLGYHVNWQSEDFARIENADYTKIMDSFGQMVHNLCRLGFVIDAETVLSKAEGKLPSAELIAEVMLSDPKYYTHLLLPYMEEGERSDMPYINFYLDYFTQGKPAYVPVQFMDYRDAIRVIRDNRGIPIVAHPGLNLKGQEEVVEELLNDGAAGLEVFNNYHTLNQADYFASLAQKRNCLMTCGSDFHGKNKPLINVGQYQIIDRYKGDLINSIEKIRKAI